jgi:aspartate aminotransferase
MSSSVAFSSNVAHLRASATIAVSQRARELRAAGRTIIDLGAGEPDFGTPAYVMGEAHAALDAGATRYPAVQGTVELREAIACLPGPRSRGVGAGEVVVGTGSKQALFNACFVLFGAGDEVLVPTPGWTSYYEIVALARATPVAVIGDPANGFKVTPELLARAATARTRGLILNSPCNPTGSVYAPDELRALLDLAESRGWWVVSDEIYRRISYGGPAASALDVAASRDRLVVVDGVAKSFAMTGWRIGWAIAPAGVAQAMTALQSHITSNAATPSQHAALGALRDGQRGDAEVARMVAEYRVRRDAALDIFAAEPATTVVRPDGAFYIFVRAGDAADAGDAAAAALLERDGVAVVPGSAFGAPSWIRMSYAAPLADVVEGAKRIARHVSTP